MNGLYKKKTLMIGVTTYNRIKILRRMAKSLSESDFDIDCCHIRIYDDCSSEYDIDDLKEIFPFAESVMRQEINRGPDYTMWFMYQDFLRCDADVLFHADSDLLFAKGWMQKGLDLLASTDGILSLFNTPMHKPLAESGKLIEKEELGAAGTFMSREAVEMICDNISSEDSQNGMDVNWSRLFRGKGIRLYSVKDSLVQHIGFYGSHASVQEYAYGAGFDIGSISNAQALNDSLEEYFEKLNENSADIRKYLYLFPYEAIMAGSDIVIYGAGTVGRDYIEQIQLTHFCNIVAVVDSNKDEDIYNPNVLQTIDCDYVILAAHSSTVRSDMKKNIISINPGLNKKIIDVEGKRIKLVKVLS